MALGAMFVTAFMLIGLTAQKVSVTATSLAGNMSLVIPVLFGLFVFRNNNKDFTIPNYLGLAIALVALALGAIQRPSRAAGTGKTTCRPANCLSCVMDPAHSDIFCIGTQTIR